MIQNPGFQPDCSQNWVAGSLCHARHTLKISEKSVHNFLNYLANTQTNRQTNKVSQKHYLLGGGNNVWTVYYNHDIWHIWTFIISVTCTLSLLLRACACHSNQRLVSMLFSKFFSVNMIFFLKFSLWSTIKYAWGLVPEGVHGNPCQLPNYYIMQECAIFQLKGLGSSCCISNNCKNPVYFM